MPYQAEDLTVEGICNTALVHLGSRGAMIDDLASDGSEEAEVFNVIYDQNLKDCFCAFPWPFATLRATLAVPDPTKEPTRDGWQYIYKLPNGCLMPRKIWPVNQVPTLADIYGTPVSTNALRVPRSDQRIPFGIEKAVADDSQVVLCDIVQPVLFYTVQVNDITQYPAPFVKALGWMLAAAVAPSITGKESDVKACEVKAVAVIHAAQAALMMSQQEDQDPECETIQARY